MAGWARAWPRGRSPQVHDLVSKFSGTLSSGMTTAITRCLRPGKGICYKMNAMSHFADRLAAAVHSRKTALCVGIDPRWDALPARLRAKYGGETLAAAAAAIE